MDAVPGSILSFDGSFGFVSPDGYSANFQVAALDKSGAITSISSDAAGLSSWTGKPHLSKFTNFVPGTSQNVQEAIKAVEAEDKETFAFNAIVEVTAGAGIVPGGVVAVDEYNSNFDGLWYVNSVVHKMGSSLYTTELTIGRDFNTTNSYKIPPVELHKEPPSPVFKTGEWKASSKRVTKYV
jgi:hypothetical protein